MEIDLALNNEVEDFKEDYESIYLEIIKEACKQLDIHDDLELSDIDEKEQKLALMESVFSNLKEDCRQVLSLFYFESKSMRDIASIMHLDENFVRLKKFRCLQYLKELIIKHT